MKVFTKISTLIFFKKQDLQSSVAMSEESFKSMRQAPTLGRLLRRSKFESQYKNHKVKNCGKNCLSCPYLLKASLHQFKLVNKTFFLKNSFNCESSNLIYVVICQGCKEEHIGQTDCLVKERIKICRQHTAAVSTIGSRRTFPYLWILKICMLPFFKILQENKSLRKS